MEMVEVPLPAHRDRNDLKKPENRRFEGTADWEAEKECALMKRNISSLILVFILLLFWQGGRQWASMRRISCPRPRRFWYGCGSWERAAASGASAGNDGVTALGLCISVVLGLCLRFRWTGIRDWKNALPRYHCIPDDSHNCPLRRCLSSGLATASGVRCL